MLSCSFLSDLLAEQGQARSVVFFADMTVNQSSYFFPCCINSQSWDREQIYPFWKKKKKMKKEKPQPW